MIQVLKPYWQALAAAVTVLGNAGCDAVQGFFVSRPIASDKVVGFLFDWDKRKRPQPPRDFHLANTDLAALPITQPAMDL